MLSPQMTEVEVRFWEGKKITHIEGTFKDFLQTLDGEIPRELRALTTLIDISEDPISRKFLSGSSEPSESLQTFLQRDVDYVHKDIKLMTQDPIIFYKGYCADWSPIILEYDVKRSIVDNFLSEVFLIEDTERIEKSDFHLLKGFAGSGKSIVLRRIAWEASITFNKLCLYLNQSSYPEYDPLKELYRKTKERIFLFIDPIGDNVSTVNDFISKAREDNLPLTIIGAERFNEWNRIKEELEPLVTHNYELKNLSKKEINELIILLTKHNSLGHLEILSDEERMKALEVQAGRQLLVALYEATSGRLFGEIILDEYNSITSLRAQNLYLTVSVLHRLGEPVRAGLISRVHNIPFTQFKERLFDPLEFIVFSRWNPYIRDNEYLSRHSIIAEMVFERVLVDPQDRYDEYIRLITSLDVDYNSDFEAFKRIMNARELIKLFPDPQMIRQLYITAHERVLSDPMLLQQEAIFEMEASDGSFEKAAELLQKAYDMAPHNKPIAHSLSVLAHKIGNESSNSLERNKNYQKSKKIASELISKGDITSHAYHTYIKVSLDELRHLIEEDDETMIERKIKDIEKVISNSQQTFPNDSYLLDVEAEFEEIIENNEKALISLEKAFENNPRAHM